jgi:ABC-type transport system substrate-binding protein
MATALPAALQTEGATGIVNILSRESLVAVSWDGRAVPRLAESISGLNDGFGVRLKLRPGVRFHNNEAVDATTVVGLLRQQIAAVGYGAESIAAIEPEGTDQIVVRYRRPDSFVLTDLNLYNITDEKRPEFSTGPFKIVSRERPVQLAAFDGYYRGRPSIDAIQIREFETPRAAWTAMMRGEVNFLHEVSRDAVKFVDEESDVNTFPLLRPYYIALVFNVRHAVLARREVRVALNEAVDRQAIVRQGMWERGRPADGPIWPYHWAYSAAQRVHSYNPEAARVRLDAAGFPPAVQRVPGRMASRLRFKCLIPSNDARFERIALVLQRQLADIDVDIELESVPVTTLLKRVIAGDFDTFLYEMTSGRTLSWVYRFWHSPSQDALPLFPSGYRAADEPLDRIRVSSSDAETRAAVADLQRTFHDNPPAVFLAWPHETRAIDTSFIVPYDRDHDVLGRVWEGRPASPSARASRQ